MIVYQLTSIPNFIKSNEVYMAEKLVDAYIDGNQQEFIQLTNKPAVNAIFPVNVDFLFKKPNNS